MRTNWVRIGMSVLVAFALSVAAASAASASADHASGAAVEATNLAPQEGDAEGGDGESRRAPQPRWPDGLAAVGELCGGDGAGGPSLEVLCNAYRILSERLPAETLRGLSRAIAVHADQVAPRWRDEIAGGAAGGAAVCRRLAGADAPNVDPELVQRCRDFVGGQDGRGGGPIAICRRLVSAVDAAEYPALAARCSELLEGGVISPADLCARLSESGDADEHPRLAQICERIEGGDDTQARTRPQLRRPDGEGAEGEGPRRGRPAFLGPDGERAGGEGLDGERPRRGRGLGRGTRPAPFSVQ